MIILLLGIVGLILSILTCFFPMYIVSSTEIYIYPIFMIISAIEIIIGYIKKKEYFRSTLSFVIIDILNHIFNIFYYSIFRMSFGASFTFYVISSISLLVAIIINYKKIPKKTIADDVIVPVTLDDSTNYILGKYILGIDGADTYSDAIIIDDSLEKQFKVVVVEKKGNDLYPEDHFINYSSVHYITVKKDLRMMRVTDSIERNVENILLSSIPGNPMTNIARNTYGYSEPYEKDKFVPEYDIEISYFDGDSNNIVKFSSLIDPEKLLENVKEKVKY